MDFVKLLEGTMYESSGECINRVFNRIGIDEHNIQNAPTILRKTRVCGHDLYLLLAEIQRVLSGEPKIMYTDEELKWLDSKESEEDTEDPEDELEENLIESLEEELKEKDFEEE